MTFTAPMMLLGLAALPALAAVYWFRSRSRQAVVSSLAFWIDPHAPRQGGRILARMQTPLTLLLELLAITALVLAAAGPALVRHDLVRPLVVVLDDSYSMLAARGDGSDSSTKRAATALNEALRGGDYLARFVLAGATPRLAGEPIHEAGRVAEVLERQWTCQCPVANLPAAVALAAEVGGPTARILVLSDHAPPEPLEGGQVEWWAYGEPLANMAFTAATRTVSGEKERILLEVANLSDAAGQGTLTLEGGNLASARTSTLDLAAGAVRQVILEVPAAAPPLRASLNGDALDIDNHVVLLPVVARPLRVLVDVADTKLRKAVVRVLAATDQTLEVSERPDLVISDNTGSESLSPGSRLPAPFLPWRLEILPAADPAAYAGPFVINHNHLLAQGLSLANAIWSASPKAPLSGLPIITAGNVPLLTESEDGAGRRRLQMSFAAATSNLQDTPDWPILFSNVVAWRRSGLPGMLTPNVRLGETASVVLAQDVKEVEVTSPDKSSRKLAVRGRRAVVPTDRPGLHLIDTPEGQRQFSVNALSRDESDLSGCQTGRWGSWNQSATYHDREIGLGWALLLVGMALMTGHAALVAKSSGGRGR